MDLECEFSDRTWKLSVPKTIYTCNVSSAVITDRCITIAAFKGKHIASRNRSHVEGLSFINANIHYIPKNLTKCFPNLAYLNVQNCELKELTSDDMVGLEKLKCFWALKNDITSLPNDLFKNMPNLQEVCFNSNSIQSFDVKVLEPVKNNLTRFNILNNPGINEFFDKGSNNVENFINILIGIDNVRKFEALSKRFEDLYTTSKHSDFTIKVRDKEFKVHKCILASQSTVFDKMFSEDAEEGAKSFKKISNFSEQAFEEFLRYFYTKKIQSEEFIIDLFELAVEFDVTDLQNHCRPIIRTSVSCENARRIFNLAEMHDFPDIKRTAFDILTKIYPEIGEFLFDKPELVSGIIEAKLQYQAKRGNK